MRISDWSSDVCSSDLDLERDRVAGLGAGGLAQALVDLQPVAALAVRLQRRLERLAFERAVDSDHAARGQLRAGACRQDQEHPCGALRARRAQQLRLDADLFRCIRHGGKVTTCIGWTVAAARRLFHRLLTVSPLTFAKLRSEEHTYE